MSFIVADCCSRYALFCLPFLSLVGRGDLSGFHLHGNWSYTIHGSWVMKKDLRVYRTRARSFDDLLRHGPPVYSPSKGPVDALLGVKMADGRIKQDCGYDRIALV